MSTKAVAEPEFASIREFCKFLKEDERTSFTVGELTKLSVAIRLSPGKVKTELEKKNLRFEGRPHEKKIRGFTANNHDRWIACPTYGGSGFGR
jgi:hypothetical protein